MDRSPFSSRARGIEVGSLPSGFRYVFNYDSPSGVKLLPPAISPEIEVTEFADSPVNCDAFGVHTNAILANPFASSKRERLAVWLHVINGCNFACHYCYIPHLNRSVDRSLLEKNSLKSNLVHPILDNLFDYCEAERLQELHVNFAGGEPTLNLELVKQFCEEATNHSSPVKITFGMISNGSFESHELIPLIDFYGIQLSLSVDGFEDSHDRIRFEVENGSKFGSWAKLVENISCLIEAGIRPYLLYTITPSNVHSIAKFSSFSHGLGLGFRFSLIRSGRIVAQDAQEMIAAKICDLYNSLAESLPINLPIQRFAAFAEWNVYQTKHVPCSSCRRYFAINTQGEISTCQMRMDSSYGNACAEPFSSIVSRVQEDPLNSSLSMPESRRGICTTCQFFHVCASGCPQHNLQAFGEMDHKSPWCFVYGTVLPIYIRAIARQLQRVSMDGNV